MSWQADVLFPGDATGEVLRLDAPISFWGGIDAVTSEVSLPGHPQYGQAIADRILVIPLLIGSSSSSAVMLQLIYAKLAPRALILGGRDAILPVGVVVSEQMGWPTIPVVVLPDPPIATGQTLTITANGHIERA